MSGSSTWKDFIVLQMIWKVSRHVNWLAKSLDTWQVNWLVTKLLESQLTCHETFGKSIDLSRNFGQVIWLVEKLFKSFAKRWNPSRWMTSIKGLVRHLPWWDFSYIFQIQVFGYRDPTIFSLDLWSDWDSVYTRENLYENLGPPLKTCLICSGTPVKTCWKIWQS